MKQVESFKKLEKKKIPENFNYDDVPSLRIEARQKLKTYSPTSIGQASRISGCLLYTSDTAGIRETDDVVEKNNRFSVL